MTIQTENTSATAYLNLAFETLDQMRALADVALERGDGDLAASLMTAVRAIAASIDYEVQTDMPLKNHYG